MRSSAGHRRRRVDERVRPGVEIRPERLDPHRRRQKGKLLFADALLQGNEPDARDLGKRRQRRKRHGAGAIRLRIGVALPHDADLEAGGADAPSPDFPQSRLGGEIGNRGRNRVEPRAERVRQAADRDLGVEWLVRRAANRRTARLAFEDRSRRSLGGQAKVASTPAAAISGK